MTSRRTINCGLDDNNSACFDVIVIGEVAAKSANENVLDKSKMDARVKSNLFFANLTMRVSVRSIFGNDSFSS